MIARYLILAFGTICLSNCIYSKIQDNRKVKSINELQTEQGKESYVETDEEGFFSKMINQRLSKSKGNDWDILFRDSAYLYYGLFLLTKKGLFADSIFKVKRSLIKQFPKFENLKFYQIRGIILDYAYKDYSFGEKFIIKESFDSLRLRQGIIFVNTKRKYQTWKPSEKKDSIKQVHFVLAVDAKTLELLSIAQVEDK